MKYDHTINTDGEITVTIKSDTADALLDAIVSHIGCDGIEIGNCRNESDIKDAIEQLALEYIAEEQPQLDYWHKDEVCDIDIMFVEVHCGRIVMSEEYAHDGRGIRYNALYLEDFS